MPSFTYVHDCHQSCKVKGEVVTVNPQVVGSGSYYVETVPICVYTGYALTRVHQP